MEGKTVFEGLSKKRSRILIRYPLANDASAMREYINTLSKEQTFIRFQGEKMSLTDEIKYLKSQLKRIKRINKNQTVQLFVIHNNKSSTFFSRSLDPHDKPRGFKKVLDKIIGICAVDMKDKTESHEGVFGLSVASEFRGEGIGSLLMKLTLEEALKKMLELKIITLGVFSNNSLAMDMYKKFGFIEYGRLPKGVFHRGQYVDHVYMYKNVREMSNIE